VITSEVGASSDKIEVERVDMGTGWMCFVAKTGTDPRPDRLPFALSRAVTDTFQQTPTLTVRSTLPIVSQGNTVAIHVWFD
jgi:hypothetical protein